METLATSPKSGLQPWAKYALRPGRPAGRRALGRALLGQGRLDEARSALLESTGLAPQRSRGWLDLGRIAELRGDPERAAALYLRAVESSAPEAEALWRLASLDLEAGRPARARAAAPEATP